MNDDKKKLRNLVMELREKEVVSVNGPAQITLIEAIRNGNNKKCLLSIRATSEVKITRGEK